MIDVDTGIEVAANKVYGPVTILTYGWSPDSRWLAYTANTQALAMRASVPSLEQKKSFPITDGLAEVSEPVFDRSGEALYLFGSTDAGPVLDWFAQSTDNRRTRNVYLVVLANNLPSPLARKATTRSRRPRKPAADGKPAAETPPPSRAYRFRGHRCPVLDLPIGAGDLSNLQAGAAGQLYYLRASADPPPPPDPQAQGPPGPPVQALHRFDLAKRADERILDQARGFYVTADGKKVMYGARLVVARRAAGQWPDQHRRRPPGRG